MASIEQDKQRFIKRHQDEISPLTGKKGADIDSSIEAYRVKIFELRKPEGAYDADAKSVALSASDPLTSGTTQILIERMISDRRFRSMLLVTDNVAAQKYASLIGQDSRYAGFAEVNTEGGVLNSIGAKSEASRVDVALTFIESQNSPSGSLAYEWKSAFGAKKLYLINEGWNGIGQRKDFFSRLNPDDVDAIFCNDESARKTLAGQMPAFAEKIRVTGTPVLDNLGLERAAAYRESGRQTLRLEPDEVAVLFQGDVPADFLSEGMYVDPRINVHTLERLVEAVTDAAERHPEKRFAVLVRPHGRDSAEDARALLAVRTATNTPRTVRIVDASNAKVRMQDVAFASDVITSINSTANHLAPKRGREAIFLGFYEAGLGSEVLRLTYGEGYQDALGADAKKHVVGTKAELAHLLERMTTAPIPPLPAQDSSSTDRILNELVREKLT